MQQTKMRRRDLALEQILEHLLSDLPLRNAVHRKCNMPEASPPYPKFRNRELLLRHLAERNHRNPRPVKVRPRPNPPRRRRKTPLRPPKRNPTGMRTSSKQSQVRGKARRRKISTTGTLTSCV